MSEINDQSSDTSSDFNWPIEAAMEGHQHDRVVFENVADQYVKGEDVTAFFTILQDIKVNADEDQIGLLRVGSTNIKECLTYAPVQFNPSTASGAVRHGTATFPSTSLPVTDDEFYQFCYILNKTKNLGSSIPFQLNCASDDIDLLSNTPVRKTKPDGLIALADQDNDDLVVIHTKRMLTEEKLRQENRQLLDINRRLEAQKDEYRAKVDAYDAKRKEQINKTNNELQNLLASHKTVIDEITYHQQLEAKLRSEYDASQSLCNQYQAELAQYADRCRILEETQAKIVHEASQVRNQLAVQSQFTKDQATQIVDLERRLMQSDELSKSSNQRQVLLEQQMRDFRLTAEKYQLSMQGQLEEFEKQTTQRDDQINALNTTNQLFKEELVSIKSDNECLVLKSNEEKELIQELQQQLDQEREQHREQNELVHNEIETLRARLNDSKIDSQAYQALKASYSEIEKRCVKHQKSEIEAKRQLAVYQEFINNLQREIQDLTERLSVGADEYRILYRKYSALEKSIETNQVQEKIELPPPTTMINQVYDNVEEQINLVLGNTDNNQQDEVDEEQLKNQSARSSLNVDEEAKQCPVCNWDFPAAMTIQGKNEHIEHHFQ
jgi:hypothetical protein